VADPKMGPWLSWRKLLAAEPSAFGGERRRVWG
jgi:hypothetical protein